MDRSVARLRYAQHKKNAKKRGIEFEFTFDEWCEIWEPHWADRGRHKDGKVMCRTHDNGSYRADNVRIDSPKGNGGDRVLMRRRPWGKRDIPGERNGAVTEHGFRSQASSFMRPDRALEFQQKEYGWIPGE